MPTSTTPLRPAVHLTDQHSHDIALLLAPKSLRNRSVAARGLLGLSPMSVKVERSDQRHPLYLPVGLRLELDLSTVI